MSAENGARTVPSEFVSGNVYDKYRTRNCLFRRLVTTFLKSARELLGMAGSERLLEVGCGPGDLAQRILPAEHGRDTMSYLGTDLSLDEIVRARRRYRHRVFLPASIAALPFRDRAFDCVVACEVFEHLEDPEQALEEVARVTADYLLISVPWEPVWRLMNLLRGSYWTHGGNTPGHVQHFSRAAIRRLVSSRFGIASERRPFPWTMLLARRSSGKA